MDTNKIFIDMAQRAHEFAEMCRLMQKIPDMPLTAEVKDALDEYAKRLGLPKEDPEAWREEFRKKQAAGVRFEKIGQGGLVWLPFVGGFENGNKEDYREVPQESVAPQDDPFAPTSEDGHDCEGFPGGCNRFGCPGGDKCYMLNNQTPHAAERALWKAQREAGTNEVWQVLSGDGVADIRVDIEPNWHPDFIYRVKPMKLTAKIIRREFYPRMAQPACLVQNWEFAGTREEYRAECEKYGYVVISEIKEVKPKTVKYYFALMKNSAGEISVKWCDESNLSALEKMGSGWGGHTIIGDIEEREIEV